MPWITPWGRSETKGCLLPWLTLVHRYVPPLTESRPRLLTLCLSSGPLRDHLHETHRDVRVSFDAVETSGGEIEHITIRTHLSLPRIPRRRIISGCGSPSSSQGPCTVSSFYRLFSAWRVVQGSLCRKPTKSGCRLPSGVGTNIRQWIELTSIINPPAY